MAIGAAPRAFVSLSAEGDLRTQALSQCRPPLALPIFSPYSLDSTPFSLSNSPFWCAKYIQSLQLPDIFSPQFSCAPTATCQRFISTTSRAVPRTQPAAHAARTLTVLSLTACISSSASTFLIDSCPTSSNLHNALRQAISGGATLFGFASA